MKILVITEPGVDGAFRYVEDLIDHLLSENHSVHFAYSDVRGSDRLVGLIARVQAAGGKTLNLHVDNHPQLADFPALLALFRFYKALRPDVIHAHSAKAGALARLLAIGGIRAPVFYSPHAYYGMGHRSRRSAWFFNMLERIFANRSITINCSGDEAEFAKNTLRIPEARRRVVLNGVSTDHFCPVGPEKKKALRDALGIPRDALVLGTLGRFSFQKDPFTLHRAFLACSERIPTLHLVHVGRGDLRDDVFKFAQASGYAHRVTWIDYLRDPVNFYQAVDGFILSSRYEGLSLAVLEALSADLPLILSDAPGNRDFAAMGLSHFWSARPESPEAFSAAIMAWSGEMRRPRPSNHRKLALVSFSSRAQFGAIEAEYRRALPAAHPALRESMAEASKVLVNNE
jgi:glycosyltransferase involved in cell wall biosynthesis